MLTYERIQELRAKLTLFTGVKGEGGETFTFQDFYDIETLMDFALETTEKLEQI